MNEPIVRRNQNHRMSLAVEAGGFVFLAGLTAVGKRGASVAEQTLEILSRIETQLAEAGVDKSRIVSAQVWLTDIASFDEFNGIWDAWVPADAKPVRACVEAALADPALNVEIMVTALR